MGRRKEKGGKEEVNVYYLLQIYLLLFSFLLYSFLLYSFQITIPQ